MKTYSYLILISSVIWSQEIYFISEFHSPSRDIYQMNLKTLKPIKISHYDGSGHYPHYNHIKLSPDKTKLLFQADPDAHDRYTIWMMDLETKKMNQITTQEGMFPNWAPDGNSIVYSGRRNEQWDVFVMNLNDKKEINITNNRVQGRSQNWGATATWRHDGKVILYASVREKILYEYSTPSKKIRQISADNSAYIHPTFLNKQNQISVAKKNGNQYDLVLLNLEDLSEQLLVENIVSYAASSWNPLNSKVLYTAFDKGKQEVFMYDLNDKISKQLTYYQDFTAMPTW